MRYSMPSTPTLLRQSEPNQVERIIAAVASHARALTIREVSDALRCSHATACRRRQGLGWTLGELIRLAVFLGVDAESLFDPTPLKGAD